MKTYRIIISLVLLPILLTCTDKSKTTENIIATVNSRMITQEEFRLFYELDPNFGIDSTGLPALKDELDFYIHQILALEKAEQDNLTSDPVFVRAVNWERRQAMLRELFRQAVQNKVEISEKELEQAYINANMSVHVRHIFSKSKEKIVNYQHMLKNGSKFSELAGKAFKDSVLAANGGDLGWIKLSDLDPQFGAAVTKLKGHEISDIVQTKWGFHLIQLLDYKKQAILNESDFQRQKTVLRKKILRQKSLELSSKYIKGFLGKLNPQPEQRIFRLVWNELVPVVDREKAILPREISFSNLSIEKCEKVLNYDLSEVFIKYNGGSMSLRDFLEGMKDIPLSHRPEFKSARELSNQIALWFRDWMLFSVAQKKGLNLHPTVLSEVRRFEEEQSYNFFLNSNLNQIDTPDSMRSYFNHKAKTHPALNRFHTLQEWQWAKAKKILDEELEKIPAHITINSEKLALENKRINWDRRIRMFMARKPE